MKRMFLIPLLCITAMWCVLSAPQTSIADDFSFSFDKVPSSVTHGGSVIMILNINIPDESSDNVLMITDLSTGMDLRRASVTGSGSWLIRQVYMSPYTFSAWYRAGNDVTDHIEASYSVLYLPPSGDPASITKTAKIPVVHDPGSWTVIEAPTCSTPGLKTTRCTYCDVEMKEEIPALDGVLSESGHVAGDWVETVAATNKTTGIQEKYCTLCGKTLETKTTPILSEIWPNNTACSLGPRFRDEDPALTGKWYMYTPVDLTQNGVKTYPLIASNVHIIGSVSVTVEDGNATVAYTLATKKIKVKEEFLTFLPGLEGLDTVDPEEMADRGFKLNEPFPVNEKLKDAGGTLMFLRLVIDYDIYADGVKRYYESHYAP